MAKAAAHFDAQTIALLKVALDEAWDRLPPKLQATMLKTTLAERILKSVQPMSAFQSMPSLAQVLPNFR
jgi:hypothetical protein